MACESGVWHPEQQRAGIIPGLVKIPYAYFRRDRADERRKGVNPDYDGGLSDLSAHPGSMQVRQHASDTLSCGHSHTAALGDTFRASLLTFAGVVYCSRAPT